MSNLARCFNCGNILNEYSSNSKPGRSDTCSKCCADVRCCFNCNFYDKSSYNECKETQAERVLDKNRSNFCDYFSLSTGITAVSESDARQEVLKKLNDLFK